MVHIRHPVDGPKNGLRVSRRTAFRLVAGVYALVMLGGTVPVPLYSFWAPEFRFGAFTTTLIFAVYAMGTVASLLLFASASDRVGRRPLLLAALAAAAVSTGLFLVAEDVLALLAARFLFGLATGVFTATATAALSELVDDSTAAPRADAATVATAANAGGLGLGALFAGIVAQQAHDPTHLVFWIYLAALLPAAVAVYVAPETVAERRRPILAVRRPAMPKAGGRGPFLSAAVAVFAAFAVAGLFSSLAPTFLQSDLKVTNHAVVGGEVALFFAAALAAQTAARGRALTSRRLPGTGLALGIVSVQAGLLTRSLPVFVVGTLVSGAAFGLVLRRGVTVAHELAPPGRRADLLATFFLCAYAGNVVPTVALGALEQSVSSDLATSLLAAAVLLLGLTAALLRAEPAPRGREEEQ